MKMYEWTVKIRVAENWIADGFDLTDDRGQSMLEKALPYAFESEIACEVIATPDADEIARAQGYKDAKHRAERRGESFDVAGSKSRVGDRTLAEIIGAGPVMRWGDEHEAELDDYLKTVGHNITALKQTEHVDETTRAARLDVAEQIRRVLLAMRREKGSCLP